MELRSTREIKLRPRHKSRTAAALLAEIDSEKKAGDAKVLITGTACIKAAAETGEAEAIVWKYSNVNTPNRTPAKMPKKASKLAKSSPLANIRHPVAIKRPTKLLQRK